MIANDVSPVLHKLFWKRTLTLRFRFAENLYGHDATCGVSCRTANDGRGSAKRDLLAGLATAQTDSERVGGRPARATSEESADFSRACEPASGGAGRAADIHVEISISTYLR
jgi:Protein of unknown function (DUF3225)